MEKYQKQKQNWNPNTRVYDRSLFRLGRGTSIKNSSVTTLAYNWEGSFFVNNTVS